MENIVEKINEQRIEDAARKLDELPPVIRARVLGFIEGAVSILQEKKAGRAHGHHPSPPPLGGNRDQRRADHRQRRHPPEGAAAA